MTDNKDPELEMIMTKRHEAFQAAAKTYFKDEKLTAAWREANTLYTLAKVQRMGKKFQTDNSHNFTTPGAHRSREGS